MKTIFTIIGMLISVLILAQEWTVIEVGTCPNEKTYGIVLADLHGDDVERLYVSTRGEPSNGAIYEWTFNGTSWENTSTVSTGMENLITLAAGDIKGEGTKKLYAVEWAGTGSRVIEYTWNGIGWDEILVENAGSPMLSCIIGDARGDGVQRLYVGGYIIHREYTWSGTGWDIVDINSTYGTEGPVAIGQAKNDGITRYYTPGSRVREFTWDGSQYNETEGISQVDGWPETVVIQDIRNDGVQRVITEDYNGTYEYTWNGTGWDEVFVDSRSGRSFMFAAKLKSNGEYSIFNTDTESSMREYVWNSNTSSYDYNTIDAATGATALIDVGTGRNDNVVRLYTPGYDSGKIYEITNIDPLIIGGSTNALNEVKSFSYLSVNYFTNQLVVKNVTDLGLLQIYDMNGKVVLSSKTEIGDSKVNLDFLQSGAYIALFSYSGKQEIKKFVVR